MGCNASKPVQPAKQKNQDAERSVVEWKILPSSVEARKKFEADGTLNKNSEPEHLELRTMLDEAIAQQAIGKYAKQTKALDIFMCWIDIQDYKTIPVESYRRSKALHIYHKYIKTDAVLQVGELDTKEREKYKNDLELAKDDPSILTQDFYDRLQSKCFIAIYHNIYIPFKLTKEFSALSSAIKKRYNNVRLQDFEYYNKLGKGHFPIAFYRTLLIICLCASSWSNLCFIILLYFLLRSYITCSNASLTSATAISTTII